MKASQHLHNGYVIIRQVILTTAKILLVAKLKEKNVSILSEIKILASRFSF